VLDSNDAGYSEEGELFDYQEEDSNDLVLTKASHLNLMHIFILVLLMHILLMVYENACFSFLLLLIAIIGDLAPRIKIL
jgi:hypothetical protein